MSRQDLTTAEVAERLDVSAITVRQWCRRGLFQNAYEEETPRGPVWKIPTGDLRTFKPPQPGRPPQKASKKGGKR